MGFGNFDLNGNRLQIKQGINNYLCDEWQMLGTSFESTINVIHYTGGIFSMRSLCDLYIQKYPTCMSKIA